MMLKMTRERDARIFQSFPSFVRQGDRFVEPVPITRRSRRVLEKTIAGLFFARVWQVHEPANGAALSTTSKLRSYARAGSMDPETEIAAMCEALGLDGPTDGPMREDVRAWVERFFEELEHADGSKRFPDEVSHTGKPMISLRDVEEQAPIYGTDRS
jgi:hypothetical protein